MLKVTQFQRPPPKRLGTVVKNILGVHQIGSKSWKIWETLNKAIKLEGVNLGDIIITSQIPFYCQGEAHNQKSETLVLKIITHSLS